MLGGIYSSGIKLEIVSEQNQAYDKRSKRSEERLPKLHDIIQWTDLIIDASVLQEEKDGIHTISKQNTLLSVHDVLKGKVKDKAIFARNVYYKQGAEVLLFLKRDQVSTEKEAWYATHVLGLFSKKQEEEANRYILYSPFLLWGIFQIQDYRWEIEKGEFSKLVTVVDSLETQNKLGGRRIYLKDFKNYVAEVESSKVTELAADSTNPENIPVKLDFLVPIKQDHIFFDR